MRIAVAIAVLLAGVLEIAFLGLSILGTGLGGVMTVGVLAGELRNEEALLGPLILVFYVVWLCVTAVAGPIHVVAGGALLLGRTNRKLLWVATVSSLLPMVTVYCAPTALLAGILGLIFLVTEPPREGGPARQ